MIFNIRELRDAVSRLRNEVPEGSNVHLKIRNEDIGNNVLCDMLELRVEYEQSPSTYDNVKEPMIITKTLEVFPASENRNNIMTTVERRQFK